jgi:hypothetical protein
MARTSDANEMWNTKRRGRPPFARDKEEKV